MVSIKLCTYVFILLYTSIHVMLEYCAKGSLADVLADPDIDLTWIFRFSLINDLVQGMAFLHRSKFSVHGCLTSNSCYISSKWELKISDYGLNKIRRSHLDSVIVNSVRDKHFDLEKGESISSRFNVVQHNKNLLWIAPETILFNTLGIYVTNTSKAADVYRYTNNNVIENSNNILTNNENVYNYIPIIHIYIYICLKK